jgi:hypothetical protein
LQEFDPETVVSLKKDAGGSGEHVGSKKKRERERARIS